MSFGFIKRLFCNHQWQAAEGGWWMVVVCVKCGKQMNSKRVMQWNKEQADKEKAEK